MTTMAARRVASEHAIAPPIVHEVLNTPGETLDAPTRVAMGAHFGRDFCGDFGKVRVHADARAAESADAVDAAAYTVGRHIVFGAGRYRSGDARVSQLLAHELTHVLQSSATAIPGPIALGPADAPHEREADAGSMRGVPAHRDASMILRRQSRNQPSGTNAGGLDARASAIVNAAAGSGPEADRAIQVVRSIIATYFAADAGLVRDVVYDASVDGLSTSSATSPAATGVITVGRQFLQGTIPTHFARRVVQVDHELEHVRQHRRGMGGAAGSSEREYLAFRREAMATPPAGSGRLQHSERVSLIDAALHNFCRLSAAQQAQHAKERDDLLALRAREQAASGHPATAPPVCAPASPPGTGPASPGPGTATPAAPSARPIRQGTATAHVRAPVPPAEAESHPRLGIDIAASLGLVAAAWDTFNPAAPAVPRGLALRLGGNRAAGDEGGNVALLAVWRDRNFYITGAGWHVGHELQGQLSAGVVGGVPTPFTVLGATGAIDVFHHQYSTVLGLFDWHALTAQAFANLGLPEVGGAPNLAQLGGGAGTGIELHPGGQNRFSLSAALMLVGQDNINLLTGAGTGSATAVFTLTVTANLLNP
jgi:hypothetical protein